MVYLDNAATTQPKFFAKDYADYWMNSNTPYANKERQALDNARERIKSCLGVKSGKVLFCRCASEAAEWIARNNVRSFYCGYYEHDSVTKEVWLRMSPNQISEFDIMNLYAHQYANQMTGKIFDIASIEKRVHRYDGGYTFFASDFTAAIGHAPIPYNLDSFCDAVWFSGHKFGAEKGIGAIWLSDRLFDYLGGATDSRTEYGILHGTVNVPAVLAMTDALEQAIQFDDSHYQYLHDYLFHYANFRNLIIKEKVQDSCSAINAITIPFVNADALCTYLASKNIYVSAGHSACSAKADYRVLEAFGYTKQEAEQTIRVSFNQSNTVQDIEVLVNAIIDFKNKF